MRRWFLHSFVILGLLVGSILVMAHTVPVIFEAEENQVYEYSLATGDNTSFWDQFITNQDKASKESGLFVFSKEAFSALDYKLEEVHNEYIIRCDIPGLEKENIEIELRSDMIVIQGARELKHQPNKTDKISSIDPHYFSHFYREIPLPAQIDEHRANAFYDKGVLTIRLPKLMSDVPILMAMF
jgi:HSP20 family molecular chaperone IbpA